MDFFKHYCVMRKDRSAYLRVGDQFIFTKDAAIQTATHWNGVAVPQWLAILYMLRHHLVQFIERTMNFGTG